MRKRIIHHHSQKPSSTDQSWLDLQRIAQVELTSEDSGYAIETALMPTRPGWRAAEDGEQTIRIIFDEAQQIRRIQLLFHENQQARTQEFVLRWSPDRGQSYRDIVRQQYNFSSPDATHEFEDYVVDLFGVTVLELTIVPDINGGTSCASLAQLRIA